MSTKQREGSDNWFYRFSYKGNAYCEGGFRLESQAAEAERLKRDKLINQDLHPEIAVAGQAQRTIVPLVCDIYFEKHGPSLKGFDGSNKRSTHNVVRLRCNRIKSFFRHDYFDEINKFHIRDFLVQFPGVGNRLRHLDTLGSIFRKIDEWNREGILNPKILCPLLNPASKWRSELKPAQKKENPRNRVLSPEEWNHFKVHLSERGREICEIALRRFLRLVDIRKISHLKIKGKRIEGLQEKTGLPFSIPVLDEQPAIYNFTNFRHEWDRAQMAAGMNYPKDHPMHFTPRDLRRTGATWAYFGSKHDLRSIQRMLGHASLATTEKYLNVTYENVEGIAAVVDELANRACNRIGTSISLMSKTEVNSNLNIS